MLPETKPQSPVEEIRLDAEKLAESAEKAKAFLTQEAEHHRGKRRKRARAVLEDYGNYSTPEEANFRLLQATDKYITDKRIRLATLSKAWGSIGKIGIPMSIFGAALLLTPPGFAVGMLIAAGGLITTGLIGWEANKLRLKRFEKQATSTFNPQKSSK